MTTRRIVPAIATLAALATLGTLAGCAPEPKSTPPAANDTAAAPATQQSLSPNPSMGDSTTGMSGGTGRPGVAGDTMGARGKAAGVPRP